MKFPEHFNNACLPTPVKKFNRFFDDIKNYSVWLKRDDLTGIELSGNKVRKLDFLLKEASEQGAEYIITCGGLQSNHCRTTAFYAAQLGMKTVLVLRGQPEDVPTGNYFMNLLLDIDIRFVTAEEYQQADTLMVKIADELPGKAYIIPEGGSNETGAWGYITAFNEIEAQGKFDTIITATGSGGTHCGLLLGKLLAKSKVEVISVNVCDNADFFRKKIDGIMHKFCSKYDYSLNWTADDIKIVDGFVGGGYGIISDIEIAVIRRLARTEGLLIDPVYGAKALIGFEEQLKKNNIPGEKILFIETGGIFGLFPLWKEIFPAKEV